jgi:hypothetical protein
VVSSKSPQNMSIVGGLRSNPPSIGRAATMPTLQTERNISLEGLNATRLPGVSRLDCCHRICLRARSVENSIRNAGPKKVKNNPTK